MGSAFDGCLLTVLSTKQRPARVGDCVAFHRPRTETDGRKHEVRLFGPAKAINISGAAFHVTHLGRLYSVPLHLTKVYLPDSVERRLAQIA